MFDHIPDELVIRESAGFIFGRDAEVEFKGLEMVWFQHFSTKRFPEFLYDSSEDITSGMFWLEDHSDGIDFSRYGQAFSFEKNHF